MIIAIAATAWFFLYNPNSSALKELLIDNAVLQATARAKSVIALVDRCREGAASLSSRTMIRKAMMEYHTGTRTWEETADFHKGLYDDGARVLYWLSGTERCMDGRVLASYGTTIAEHSNCDYYSTDTQLQFNFVQNDTFIAGTGLACADSLRVISPVLEGDVLLGHDCLCSSSFA